MSISICVLGAFSFRSPSFDGQTIKTRNLLSLLQEKKKDVDYFDTQDFKYNRFSIAKMFWKIMRCKKLYYLPAQNNLAYLFPIIYWVCKLFRVQIHYFVVGGWLAEFLKDKPRHRLKLAKIAGIHCETVFLKGALQSEYGLKNVDVFPNFRITDFKPTAYHEDDKLHLVFMARVIKMKGLDLIFELGRRINEASLQNSISIDFYGPQQNDDNDIEYFDTNVKKFPFMRYHGPLKPEEIYGVLEKFDVMLLPTHFFTEGLPGSVVDAYISGIPVIVTKWKHATEFVEDGKTGVIIPFEDDGTALFEAVMVFFNENDLLNRMKQQANKKAYDFSTEKAWNLIQSYN
ncbi:glycosyltransferase family 4 protein [Xylanibacter brevis]|uniref:glycosyltransferase family 4 protein n=1 Tax=Xylanibacter brevis TaxID=83231 RepID=UPI0004866617|nr:glycosyltransferase family 4 protein [Xylanibacter brevis]